jgi:DNA-directed RNA polymerase specialized sigma subunit
MIRTETEYRNSLKKLKESEQVFRQQEASLAAEGLRPDQIKRAMDPSRVFLDQIKDEIATYQRLKEGEFDELHNLHGMGQMLIGIRIASGLSQRELAERLGVHESQVSRDERNEYYGVTVERAARVLDSMQAEVRSVVHLKETAA